MIPFKGLTAYNASHSPFGWSNKDAPMVFVHTRINVVTKRMLLIYEHQLPLPLEFMFVCSFQSFS